MIARYVCSLDGDGCDEVVEVIFDTLPVSSPACPVHDVTMLLDGVTADPVPADAIMAYADAAAKTLDLLELLRPWSSHGRRVQQLAAGIVLALGRVPEGAAPNEFS